MKKISQKTEKINVPVETSKTNTTSLIKKLPYALLIIVLAGAFWVYNRYWNVATVNGKGISRMEFYKTLEGQGGKQTLDQMIQESLVMQEASKKKITIGQDVGRCPNRDNRKSNLKVRDKLWMRL